MSNAKKKTGGKVRIERSSNGYAVVSAQPLVAGEAIFACEGATIPAPTRFSVCIDGVHIEPVTPARYLNHSCMPNCRFDGVWLIAATDIVAGSELTFDYAQTEPVIAAPFDCRCGASNCRGRIGH